MADGVNALDAPFDINDLPTRVGRPGWTVIGQPAPETKLGVVSPSGLQGPVPTGRTIITIGDGKGNTQPVYVRDLTVEGPTGRMLVGTIDEGPGNLPPDRTGGSPNVSAPKDQRYIISRKPDGTLTADQNPNYSGEKDDKSQLQPFGDQLLRVNPDGSVQVLATKPKDAKEPTTVAFGDTLYSFDGTSVTPLISKPKEPSKPTTEVRNGKTYQWDPSTNTWSEAAGLPIEKKPVAVYGTGSTDKFRITIDDQGNVVSKEPNENYVEPKGTQLTPDAVSPNVPILKPDGTIQWVPNQNRVPAGQAMQDLLAQVGVKVNGGDLSMDDAKNMLTGAVNVMNAQTSQLNAQTAQTTAQTQQQQQIASAASTVLEHQRQGAQTGAGLLQNRVTNAQGMLNSILGLAGQGQRSGNMGGGLMSAPAGLGEQLIGGIQGWTTELGGGQGVYDTAARMVTAADPQNGQSPEAHVAMGVLTQMLQKYQDATGQPHPAVAATTAAQQSLGAQGLVAPVTTPTPAPAPEPATSGLLPAGWAGVPGKDPRLSGIYDPTQFVAPVTVGL